VTKAYIAISIVSITIFQFVLIYFGITMRDTFVLWLIISMTFAIVLPFVVHPLLDWIACKITLHRERIQRRRNYELFRDGVKSGLIATDEQFNDEVRKVIK